MANMTLNEAWQFVQKYGDSIPYPYEDGDIDDVVDKVERLAEMIDHLLMIEKLTRLPILEDQKYIINTKLRYFNDLNKESKEHYDCLVDELDEIENQIDNLMNSIQVEEFDLEFSRFT